MAGHDDLGADALRELWRSAVARAARYRRALEQVRCALAEGIDEGNPWHERVSAALDIIDEEFRT